MKQELQDIAVELARATPAVAMSSFTLSTALTIVTIVFVVLQVVYLMRKWYREETEWGRKLKRWAEGVVTKPGEL